MRERRKERRKKNHFVGGGLGIWWLGGHENVNLYVSQAIYSGLGMQSGERQGDSVSVLNGNHIVQ